MLVKRDRFTKLSTGSEVFIDGEFFCYGLEPPTGTKVKPYAVPAGQYRVSIRFSPRFQKDMPHVEDVPGFDGVLIHVGNYPPDTHGCLIVGKTRSIDFVGVSVDTYKALFTRIQDAGGATIQYEDSPLGIHNV